MTKAKFKKNEIETIPEKWMAIPFGDAVEINPKRQIKKGQQTKFVSMTDVDAFTKRVSRHTTKIFNGGSKFKNGDTLMARITPCLENGKTAYVDFLGAGEIAAGSTEFLVLTGRESTSDSDFVYYLSVSPQIRNVAIAAMTGTSGRQRVETDKLSRYTIKLPPPKEQKAIAEILSSLDDKIELNRQMNKTLESIAQALFKQWFVDFEFPDKNGKPYKSSGGKMVKSELGEIPEGWNVRPLSDFCSVKTGKKDANISTSNGLYPFFTCAQGVLRTDVFSFDSSSILLAGNGDFNVKWYEGKFEAYQRTYVLTPAEKELLGFIFYTIKYFLDEITAGHRGSVIRFITKGMIEGFKIATPNNIELLSLSRSFYEINQLIDFFKQQEVVMTNIRDGVLPKLLNGTIQV